MRAWYFPLERVAQGDDNGCAIACVATVAGLTYARSRHEAFPTRRSFKDDSSIRISDREVRLAFRRLGFRTRYVDEYRDAKRPCLVSFAWYPGNRTSLVHCVVWDPWKKRFIDPANHHTTPHEADQFRDLWLRTGWRCTLVEGRL